MKNILTFTVLFLPLLAFSQKKKSLEFYLLPTYTSATQLEEPYKGWLGCQTGMAMTGQTGSSKIQWLAGMQFSVFSVKTEYELRWGTQHDGQGGFVGDPDILTRKHRYFFAGAPLGIRYFITDSKAKFFLQPTISPSIFLTAYYTQSISGSHETSNISEYDQEAISRLNAQAALAAGLHLPLSKNMNLLLMPQGGLQVFSAAENSTTGSRLYSVGLRAGLQFGL